jgi:hypothetical protein
VQRDEPLQPIASKEPGMKTIVLLISMFAMLTCTWHQTAEGIFQPTEPNTISFDPVKARFIRLTIPGPTNPQPCLDELEVYGPDSDKNLALAATGAKATASSCLAGFDAHRISHLNDGLYGNEHSWISEGTQNEWAQIELPETTAVSSVVFSRDREGKFDDRMLRYAEVQVSTDGVKWDTVAQAGDALFSSGGVIKEADLLRYAFESEDSTWQKYDPTDRVERVFKQTEEMLDRYESDGLNVANERAELAKLRQEAVVLNNSSSTISAKRDFFLKVRTAKRKLFFRHPDLAPLERILFVKRQPYEPSHNYSVIFDASGAPGGSVCILEIPRTNGRLEPGQAKVTKLFDSKNGVARDPVLSFDAQKIFFGYRASMDPSDYFHLWTMNVDGSGLKEITKGPFHDFFPCPLPDGGLAFISTRCKERFLCWRPQAFVLFRMETDGSNIQPLSFSNLSEWCPVMMNDGRILWTRSEYLDKGANFGHTLWAIRPDGTHPELIFGNNTLNCYANSREVPNSNELLCTLISHGGDLNGPIALIDTSKGKYNPKAITNITPDVEPRYDMDWAWSQCFRDPCPISKDFYLCSHAPLDNKFGLYVIDRYGNREVLYFDSEFGCMAPIPVQRTSPPPVLYRNVVSEDENLEQGVFSVADVYMGIEPTVKRGTAKYIRVCQEVKSNLAQLPNGEYQRDHPDFENWYASPTNLVRGPYGWPSYVAKTDLGIAPIEEDGSVSFYAPAGKVLYFELLDKDFNEIQRMRSVIQLQSGEKRSCIGCHEDRKSAPSSSKSISIAMRHGPSNLQAPPWGAVPFSFEKVVQPVLDAKCISCHNADHKQGLNLTGDLDNDGVPASYRTMIEKGWVNYFDYDWGARPYKAEPLTFGSVKSKLWEVLNAGHHNVSLTSEEIYSIKCWTDLNCPLWPDYVNRLERIKNKTASCIQKE